MESRRLRIAVDVAGTFTDATLWDPVGPRLVGAKALTTPAGRAIGAIEGINAALAAAGARPEEVRDGKISRESAARDYGFHVEEEESS